MNKNIEKANAEWVKAQGIEGQPKPSTPPRRAPKTLKLDADNIEGIEMMQDFEHIDFVLPGLEDGGSVAFLVASGGASKSYWALQASISVATGVDIAGLVHLGWTVQQGKVSYIATEDSPKALRNRKRHIYEGCSKLWSAGALEGMKDFKLHYKRPGELDMMKNLDHWVNVFKDHKLIVIDTLSQCHTGDENKAKDMIQLVKNLYKLADKTGASILVLHHTNKAGASNGAGQSSHESRGSTALMDNVRIAYSMHRMTKEEAKLCDFDIETRKKYVCWNIIKGSNIGDQEPLWFHKVKGGVLIPDAKIRVPDTAPDTKGKK